MIIIGDVHGSYKTLLALIDKCPKDEEFCFVGDLVDRGPDSEAVVSLVIQQGWKCVQGNHEKMMADAILNSEYDAFQLWIMNGGQQTQYSYSRADGLIQKHAEWMKSLPPYLEFPEIKREDGRYLFVSHAGLYEDEDLETALIKQTRNQDILWHRDTIFNYPEIFQVIGHTPQKNGHRLEPHFANIDTGAVFNSTAYGIMTALRFPQMEIYTQRNVDNLPVRRSQEVQP